MVVGTPGRILDLTSKGAANLENCKMLILDEVDKLLSVDFKNIVAKIIEIMPRDKQIILMSATYPIEIKDFYQKYIPEP